MFKNFGSVLNLQAYRIVYRQAQILNISFLCKKEFTYLSNSQLPNSLSKLSLLSIDQQSLTKI